MKRWTQYSIISLLCITAFTFIAAPVSAQAIFDRSDYTTLGLGTAGLVSFSDCIKNGNCGTGHIFLLANNLMMWMVGVSGAIALFMYVMGGLWMLFSMGNQSRVERGKDILTGTTIALVYILGSYLIVQFVVGALKVKEESGAQIKSLQCGKSQQCPVGKVCINDQCKSQCDVAHPDWKCVTIENCVRYISADTFQCTPQNNCDSSIPCTGEKNVCCLSKN